MATFKERFCERFHCSPCKYEAAAFRELAYPHAHALLWFTSSKSNLWHDDFALLRDLEDATNFREVTAAVKHFTGTTLCYGNLLRRSFRLRLSGSKAIRLARELFHEAGT